MSLSACETAGAHALWFGLLFVSISVVPWTHLGLLHWLLSSGQRGILPLLTAGCGGIVVEGQIGLGGSEVIVWDDGERAI
jgi:hypothetical protein